MLCQLVSKWAGIGKEIMEEKILDELEEISKDLRNDPGIRKGQSKEKEGKKDLEILFAGATANIISGLLFGETSKEDADFEGLVSSVTSMASDPPGKSLVARTCPKYESLWTVLPDTFSNESHLGNISFYIIWHRND